MGGGEEAENVRCRGDGVCKTLWLSHEGVTEDGPSGGGGTGDGEFVDVSSY